MRGGEGGHPVRECVWRKEGGLVGKKGKEKRSSPGLSPAVQLMLGREEAKSCALVSSRGGFRT